ncbi:hypothetical protein [Glutamicibacter uratoxydans]|uniref:hypothetical protein n=1 Tax=Glutamicibacter uratoxydans TaxID=43667 RepID=UPI003D6E9B6C
MTELIRAMQRVTIEHCTFFVDTERPVALLRREQQPDELISWPDLKTGIHSPELSLHPTANALWVLYRADGQRADEQRYPALSSPAVLAAVRLGLDGSRGYVRAEGVKFLGMTSHGLWTGSSLSQEIDDVYDGGELPDSFAHPDTLCLHRPQQPTVSVEFDRHLDFVREHEHGVELWVNPSPPIVHPDGEGGASYEYRCSAVPLPVLEQLPARLRFRDLVPQGWGKPVQAEDFELLEAEFLQIEDTEPEFLELPPTSLPTWELIELSAIQREQALTVITDQLQHLEQYWRSETNELSPLSDGLANAQLQVTGAWPQTTVEVSFTHPYYPAGRILRRIEVFDSAGRIHSHEYVSIHLMEDLDTHDLPPLSEAREGILEI